MKTLELGCFVVLGVTVLLAPIAQAEVVFREAPVVWVEHRDHDPIYYFHDPLETTALWADCQIMVEDEDLASLNVTVSWESNGVLYTEDLHYIWPYKGGHEYHKVLPNKSTDPLEFWPGPFTFEVKDNHGKPLATEEITIREGSFRSVHIPEITSIDEKTLCWKTVPANPLLDLKLVYVVRLYPYGVGESQLYDIGIDAKENQSEVLCHVFPACVCPGRYSMRTEARDIDEDNGSMCNRGLWWTVYDNEIDAYFYWVGVYSDHIQYDSHYSAYDDENSDEGDQFMMVVDAVVNGESYDPENPEDVEVYVQPASSVLSESPDEVAYDSPFKSYRHYMKFYHLSPEDISSDWETKYGFRFSKNPDCLDLASTEIPAGSLRKLPLIQNLSIDGDTLSWDKILPAEGAEIAYAVRILKFEDGDGDGKGEVVGIPIHHWLHDSGRLFFVSNESPLYALPTLDNEENPFQAGERYALRVEAWEIFNGEIINRSKYYPNFLYPGVSDSATVSPSAVLGLNVTIGEGSTIKEDSVIGDNTVINENVTIEQDVKISSKVTIGSNTTIGTDTKIGTKASIGNDVSSGEDVKIGKKVKIGNNVLIGNDVKIAENTEIPDDTVIPDGTKLK